MPSNERLRKKEQTQSFAHVNHSVCISSRQLFVYKFDYGVRFTTNRITYILHWLKTYSNVRICSKSLIQLQNTPAHTGQKEYFFLNEIDYASNRYVHYTRAYARTK